jgi:hypothetical protein
MFAHCRFRLILALLMPLVFVGTGCDAKKACERARSAKSDVEEIKQAVRRSMIRSSDREFQRAQCKALEPRVQKLDEHSKEIRKFAQKLRSCSTVYNGYASFQHCVNQYPYDQAVQTADALEKLEEKTVDYCAEVSSEHSNDSDIRNAQEGILNLIKGRIRNNGSVLLSAACGSSEVFAALSPASGGSDKRQSALDQIARGEKVHTGPSSEADVVTRQSGVSAGAAI